jgi:hypothetical protein
MENIKFDNLSHVYKMSVHKVYSVYAVVPKY